MYEFPREKKTDPNDEEEDYMHCVNGVLEMDDGMQIPAICYIEHMELVFKTQSGDMESPERIAINLIGICAMEVTPHSSVLNMKNVDIESPNIAAVLEITYLNDIMNKSSYRTLTFAAIRGQLTKLRANIEEAVVAIKSHISFRGPNLKGQNAQDGLPERKKPKRHSNSFNLCGSTSGILSSGEMDALRLSFGSRIKLAPWSKIFSASKDGVSLGTLFKACEKRAPILLVMSNNFGDKFGCFLPQGLHKALRFYGTGETFVFTYKPVLSVYKWSHKNEYFTVASSKDISVGNSKKGGAALYIGVAMKNGFSDPCDTFDSPSLTTKPRFQIRDLEAWHINNTPL